MYSRKVLLTGLILALMLSLALAPLRAQDEPVTLRIMHWSDSMSSESVWWNEILQGFQELYPNVTIENNFVPFAQYLPTLEAMIAGEELPDVFFGHVKVAALGRGGLAVNYSEVFDEEYLSRFYPGPMRQFTFDGNVYALPWTAQMFGIFVNPAIMEELGLEPPVTWDELVEMSPIINEAGYIPVSWGNAAMNVCPDFVLPLITQYGGDVWALDDLSDPDISWDSEPVVNALALLQRLAENDVFVRGINGVTEEQGAQLWYQGRAAMFYSGSWYPGIIREQAPEELVESFYVVKNPALAEGEIHWSGNGSGEGWVVKAGSPNTEIALEFVQYLLSDETYGQHIFATQNMPAMESALGLVEDEHVQEMTSWVLTDGANHILFGEGSWEGVSNVCASILDGSISPEDGAAKIQADVLATRAR
jgi:raffinose/stachyose/melibiose transport system substrate-binding protein